jgi:hypothetical protein
MLFRVFVFVLDMIVRGIVGLFSMVRNSVVSLLNMIPVGNIFVSGLDSVVNVNVLVSNISLMFTVISAMLSLWGIWKIIKLIRG